MKTKAFAPILTLVALMALPLFSCKNDDPNVNNQDMVESTIQSGSWKITSFIDSGKDETQHFAGYTFTFNSNGNLVATNGSTTYTGQWNLSDSNSNDDSLDDLDFNIFFNLSNDFEDLNEDWDITSKSDSKIQLIHISGGNGGTDTLVFEKI